MRKIRWVFLLFVCGVIASCSSTKKVHVTDPEGRIISGDINVYWSTKTVFVADANSRRGGHTALIDIYKIQKGANGEKLPLKSKNLIPMLDNYEPAMKLVGKYKRVDNGHKVWRTANLLTLLGGVALIAVGTNNAVKGYNKGGGQILGGFGIAFIGVGSYLFLNKAENKNEKRLMEAIKIYNARIK